MTKITPFSGKPEKNRIIASQLFGDYTRLYDHELGAAQALAKQNDLLIPVYIGDYAHTYEERFNNNKNICEELSFFSNGVLIPYDFLRLPNTDLANPEVITRRGKSGKYENTDVKFIGKPDALFLDISGKNIHVFPIDITDKVRAELSGSKKVRQISKYNLAILYLHSKYLRHTLDFYKSKDYNIFLENGAIIEAKENNNNKHIKKLEDYVLESLDPESYITRGTIIERIKEIAGIHKDDDIALSLDFLSKPEVIEHVANSKNMINKRTFYQNPIFWIEGLTGPDIYRLKYIPTEEIMTNNPSISKSIKLLNEIKSHPINENLKGIYINKLSQIQTSKKEIEQELSELTNRENELVDEICREIVDINNHVEDISGKREELTKTQTDITFIEENLVSQIKEKKSQTTINQSRRRLKQLKSQEKRMLCELNPLDFIMKNKDKRWAEYERYSNSIFDIEKNLSQNNNKLEKTRTNYHSISYEIEELGIKKEELIEEKKRLSLLGTMQEHLNSNIFIPTISDDKKVIQTLEERMGYMFKPMIEKAQKNQAVSVKKMTKEINMQNSKLLKNKKKVTSSIQNLENKIRDQERQLITLRENGVKLDPISKYHSSGIGNKYRELERTVNRIEKLKELKERRVKQGVQLNINQTNPTKEKQAWERQLELIIKTDKCYSRLTKEKRDIDWDMHNTKSQIKKQERQTIKINEYGIFPTSEFDIGHYLDFKVQKENLELANNRINVLTKLKEKRLNEGTKLNIDLANYHKGTDSWRAQLKIIKAQLTSMLEEEIKDKQKDITRRRAEDVTRLSNMNQVTKTLQKLGVNISSDSLFPSPTEIFVDLKNKTKNDNYNIASVLTYPKIEFSSKIETSNDDFLEL